MHKSMKCSGGHTLTDRVLTLLALQAVSAAVAARPGVIGEYPDKVHGSLRAPLNSTTPFALEGNRDSICATCCSRAFLPVPSTTTCALLPPPRICGSASSSTSTPFCSSSRPTEFHSVL